MPSKSRSPPRMNDAAQVRELQPPRQTAVGHRRHVDVHGFGLPDLIGGIEPVDLLVIAVGHRPQLVAAQRQPRQVAAAHAVDRMLGEQAQFLQRLGRHGHCTSAATHPPRPSQTASGQHLGEVAFGFEPGLAVTGAFLRQQHVHHFRGLRRSLRPASVAPDAGCSGPWWFHAAAAGSFHPDL